MRQFFFRFLTGQNYQRTIFDHAVNVWLVISQADESGIGRRTGYLYVNDDRALTFDPDALEAWLAENR